MESPQPAIEIDSVKAAAYHHDIATTCMLTLRFLDPSASVQQAGSLYACSPDVCNEFIHESMHAGLNALPKQHGMNL